MPDFTAVNAPHDRNQQVWFVVSGIPAGAVATYGQVARHSGLLGPTAARQVGYALAALAPGSSIPWHRVVSASGRCSPRADALAATRQRRRLAAEGVAFAPDGRIDLARFGWRPADGSEP